MKIRALVFTGMFFCCGSFANAAIYVGSYAVFDGPYWEDNPPVYSAREAAAFIFGGAPTDYAISIDPSLDESSITYTGWYDGWGEHDGMIFNQDYKLDTGNPGYNDPAGGPARSAYVRDGLFDTDTYRNYVWREQLTAAPEPISCLVWGGLIFAAACANRRRVLNG